MADLPDMIEFPNMSPGYRPLDGYSLVIFATSISARYCGRLFALFGADVVQVETIAGADERIGYGEDAGKAFGRWLDDGKVLVNLAEAYKVANQLTGPSSAIVSDDVVAFGEREALLIDITTFGHSGPLAAWHAPSPLVQALSGTCHSFGEAGRAPILPQGHQTDVMAGATAFIAAAASLFGRTRGYQTRLVEVTELESALCVAEVSAIDPAGRGSDHTRLGVNRFVPSYPCSIYRSLDGWIGVTALTPAQWATLCKEVGHSELADDPRLATTVGRLQAADEIDAILAGPLAERSTSDWVEIGIRRRIPFSPVLDHKQLLQADMWKTRSSFQNFEPGLAGPALPFRITPRGEFGRPMAVLPSDPAGPLAGVRVVDFTMGWAGPLSTRHLADLGADIIKIESEAYPDWWRGWEKQVTSDPPTHETRLPFMAVNRNKRDVVLDLRDPSALEQAKALIGLADIVIDNYAAGTLDKLGLDATRLHQLRPGLVTVAMSAFGNMGPLSGIRGYGSTVEQASGLPFANGHEHWVPTMQHVAWGDPTAGIFGTVAALVGIIGQKGSGGVAFDLSQVETLFQVGADAFVAVQINGTAVPRNGSDRLTHSPCGVFPSLGEDNWIALAIQDATEWQSLCQLIDRDDLAARPELATVAGRRASADEIYNATAMWTTLRDQRGACEAMQSLGIAATPVNRGRDLIGEPQLQARGFWQQVERRFIGRYTQAASPYLLDGNRPALRCPPPTLGEHTSEVLEEITTA